MDLLKASWAALLILLFGICTLATPRQQNPSMQGEMRPTVIVHDLSHAGITLISPEDPKFDFEVSQIVSAQVASVALTFKPLLVIVANGSQHTIVAYSVVWRMTEKNGRKSTIVLPFKYPDALTGIADSGGVSPEDRKDHALTNGEKRLISTDMQIDSSWEDEYYLDQLRSRGYMEEVASSMTIGPGQEILFSIPINHLSERWHVEIPFDFELPRGKGPLNSNTVGLPVMVVQYTVWDLPRNAQAEVLKK